MFEIINFKNFKGKTVFLIVFIMIISLLFSSGCIEDSYFDYDSIIILSSDIVEDSLTLAEKWFNFHLNNKGYFNYFYNPINGNYSNEINIIHQLMASRLISEMSQENYSLMDLHQYNLDYINENWYKNDNTTGYGYIFYNETSSLSANAIYLRTLLSSPFYDDYQDKAYNLSNTILSLQSPNGSLEYRYLSPDYEYNMTYLESFYYDEVINSLIDVYIKTENYGYLEAAIKSQDYYLDKFFVYFLENNNQSISVWHTKSLAKLYEITGEQKYIDAIFVLNDILLDFQDKRNNSTLGSFNKFLTLENDTPQSLLDSIYLEQLAYAYEIADLINDTKHKDKYKIGIILGVNNIINLQYKNSDDMINGAIRYNFEDYRIRIDSTQKTIDNFRKILDIFAIDGYNIWNYSYDLETDTLVEYNKMIEETSNDAKWYALFIGLILSIIFLFIIYLVIRIK